MEAKRLSPFVRKAALPAALALLLVGSLLVPASATHGGPGDCAVAKPTSELTKGMLATGYTVSEGTTPQSFTAEVLGVLEDGIGPGRDMIVVEADSPAIDKAGGVWFGMSGSPVYVGGELIGAVAFGLGFGPSKITGLTAAEDLIALAERPVATSAALPRKVKLDRKLHARVARTVGRSTDETPSSMRLLKSPLSVSGLGARGLDGLNQVIGREKLGFVPYAGSSISAAPDPEPTRPEPGGNFAAAISYGDVSFAGVGTTSYVCGDKVVAFGHSMFGLPQGRITLGANAADAIGIIDDSFFGPFKLANVTGTYGALDQDRFAGIRSILGASFPTVPVTSTVTTEDGLASRDGSTDIVDPEFTAFGTFIHLLSNIDFTRDEISEGASALSWTITGTRESGAPWQLSRSNMYSSDFDIAIESVFEIETQLFRILFNRLEDVTVDSVDVDATVGTEERSYQLTDLLVSTGGGDYASKETVKAFPGDVISLRAVLKPSDGSADVLHDFEVQVPETARIDHFVKVSGGPSRGGFGFGFSEEVAFGNACFSSTVCKASNHNQPKAESFDELLDKLQSTPQNNDLVATMKGLRGKTKATYTQAFDRVVRGEAFLYIRVRGVGGCCFAAPVEGKG